MATKQEIEAAANEICIAHTGRVLSVMRGQNAIDYRKTARKALEAAEAVRLREMGAIFGPENVI